jgi:hypothetical protein
MTGVERTRALLREGVPSQTTYIASRGFAINERTFFRFAVRINYDLLLPYRLRDTEEQLPNFSW